MKVLALVVEVLVAWGEQEWEQAQELVQGVLGWEPAERQDNRCLNGTPLSNRCCTYLLHLILDSHHSCRGRPIC